MKARTGRWPHKNFLARQQLPLRTDGIKLATPQHTIDELGFCDWIDFASAQALNMVSPRLAAGRRRLAQNCGFLDFNGDQKGLGEVPFDYGSYATESASSADWQTNASINRSIS